jgi:hypothetical protein
MGTSTICCRKIEIKSKGGSALIRIFIEIGKDDIEKERRSIQSHFFQALYDVASQILNLCHKKGFFRYLVSTNL